MFQQWRNFPLNIVHSKQSSTIKDKKKMKILAPLVFSSHDRNLEWDIMGKGYMLVDCPATKKKNAT